MHVDIGAQGPQLTHKKRGTNLEMKEWQVRENFTPSSSSSSSSNGDDEEEQSSDE